MKYTLTLALAILLLAATGRGQTTNEIHLGCYPLNPIVGQAYRFGNDPNTHTYMGGNCWNSTLLHWSEDRPREKRLDDLIIGTSPPPVASNYMAYSASNALMNVESRVRKLAAIGEICKVFGHWYPNVWIGERKCKLCGKVKTKTEVWK